MHGLGNDFVFVDGLAQDLSGIDLAALAVEMCHRRFGIGADGLNVIGKTPEGRLSMRLINCDGSEGGMCGNGIRCFARLVSKLGYVSQNEFECEAGGVDLLVQMLPDGRVRVDMGKPQISRAEVGISPGDPDPFHDVPVEFEKQHYLAAAAGIGNPHLAIFVDRFDDLSIERWGPVLEHHPAFPNRTNVHLVHVLDRGHIRQKTWERGAGATLACGSGAGAVVVAAFLTGRIDRKVSVELPGGTLEMEYDEAGHVWMAGPAEEVFEGEWLTKPPALR